MSRLLPSADSKWTQVYSETPLYWGVRLYINGARRLKHHPKECLVSSTKYWSLVWEISRIVSYSWIYGMVCVSWGFYCTQYIDNGGAQSSAAVFIFWLADICWHLLLVLSRGLPFNGYLYRSGIDLSVQANLLRNCFFRHVAASLLCSVIAEIPVQ